MPQTRKHINFRAIVAIFASGFGIGIGLCGVDYLLASKGIGKSTQEFGVGPLDGVSLVVMFFSALGLALTLMAWVVVAIGRSLASRSASREPTRLSDKEDDK